MIGKLPHKIRLSSKDYYGVVVVPRFEEETDLGHCDYEKKEIRLCVENQSEKSVVGTLLHESLHYIGHKYKLGLTESQVAGLETGIINLFKMNSRFAILFFKTFVKRLR